jgi:hypothetical protein
MVVKLILKEQHVRLCLDSSGCCEHDNKSYGSLKKGGFFERFPISQKDSNPWSEVFCAYNILYIFLFFQNAVYLRGLIFVWRQN